MSIVIVLNIGIPLGLLFIQITLFCVVVAI